MGDVMREIRDIYQRWLEGGLSQEDALFAIGDALDEAPDDSASGSAADQRPALQPAVARKGS